MAESSCQLFRLWNGPWDIIGQIIFQYLQKAVHFLFGVKECGVIGAHRYICLLANEDLAIVHVARHCDKQIHGAACNFQLFWAWSTVCLIVKANCDSTITAGDWLHAALIMGFQVYETWWTPMLLVHGREKVWVWAIRSRCRLVQYSGATQ